LFAALLNLKASKLLRRNGTVSDRALHVSGEALPRNPPRSPHARYLYLSGTRQLPERGPAEAYEFTSLRIGEPFPVKAHARTYWFVRVSRVTERRHVHLPHKYAVL
jgi:hypothetical protein